MRLGRTTCAIVIFAIWPYNVPATGDTDDSDFR